MKWKKKKNLTKHQWQCKKRNIAKTNKTFWPVSLDDDKNWLPQRLIFDSPDVVERNALTAWLFFIPFHFCFALFFFSLYFSFQLIVIVLCYKNIYDFARVLSNLEPKTNNFLWNCKQPLNVTCSNSRLRCRACS